MSFISILPGKRQTSEEEGGGDDRNRIYERIVTSSYQGDLGGNANIVGSMNGRSRGGRNGGYGTLIVHHT